MTVADSFVPLVTLIYLRIEHNQSTHTISSTVRPPISFNYLTKKLDHTTMRVVAHNLLLAAIVTETIWASKECFKSSMAPFTNGGVFLDYPAIKGQVKICFDETLTTAGVLTMSVTGLINRTKAPSPGGVHIHRGANCTSIGSQEGHFFNNCSGSANPTGRKQNCDPWYITTCIPTSPQLELSMQ